MNSVLFCFFLVDAEYCVILMCLQIPEAAQVMCLKEEQFKTCNNRYIHNYISLQLENQ